MNVGAALLIGNAGYMSPIFPRLRTPCSDVANIADRLRELGFAVTVCEDGSRAQMAAAFGRFRDQLAQLPTERNALFYFAGHGLQHSGENYLVPADVSGDNELEIHLSCFRLSEILSNLCWRDDQQKFVVLDMCRTNELPGVTRGVQGLSGVSERMYERVKEVSILYATDPGHIAQDGAAYGSSPVCRGLLEALKQPHRPVRELSMQITDYVCRVTQNTQKPWDMATVRSIRPFVPIPDDVPCKAGDAPSTIPSLASDADRFVATHGHWVHKLKAKDTSGRWAYYFVLVEPEREQAFLAMIKTTPTQIADLEDYGKVIASNYGEAPSEDVRHYLKTRYGFDV